MTEVDLNALIPADVLPHIRPHERAWLEQVFTRLNGRYPSLEEMWQLLDEPWREFGCDTRLMDDRITQFYAHPVWLLNGLFIEQHELSLKNRHSFTDWIVSQKPRRVADYGGGYGSLARLIGMACPDTLVEVIEPHPHPAAIALAAVTQNVRYQPNLTGEYDILIATDVFEHVPDPLGLAVQTAEYLCSGGQYLIANCFAPVISICKVQTPAFQAGRFHLQPSRWYGWQGHLERPAGRRWTIATVATRFTGLSITLSG